MQQEIQFHVGTHHFATLTKFTHLLPTCCKEILATKEKKLKKKNKKKTHHAITSRDCGNRKNKEEMSFFSKTEIQCHGNVAIL